MSSIHPAGKAFVRIMPAALTDAAIIVVAYVLAFSVRSFTAPLEVMRAFPFMIFFSVVAVTSLYFHGVYRRIWAQTSGRNVTIIFRAVFWSFFLALILMVLMVPRPVPLSVVILAGLLGLSGLVFVRFRGRVITSAFLHWRAFWRAQEAAPRRTRVLIVGAGESGEMVALKLSRHVRDQPYTVVGFVDDNPAKQGMYVEGAPVLGKIDQIVALSQHHAIDVIVVAIHNISGPDFRRILGQCEQTTARIKIIPDVLSFTRPGIPSSTLLRDVGPEDLLGRSPVSRDSSGAMDYLNDKVVLVTGAAGSIGSELSRQLAAYALRRLVLLDNNESALHDLQGELASQFPNCDLVPVLADITSTNTLRPVFERFRPQIIFHAAAYKHVPMLEHYPAEAIRVNLGGTRSLARLALAHQVERFVYISTDKAVRPTSVMGASKRVGEMYLHALSRSNGHQTLFTTVRFGNVLGSRGSVVTTFNSQIAKGGPVTVTHPDMTRYFMSIPEASRLVLHAGHLTRGDDMFVLRMGEVVRIVELAERMIRMRGLIPYEDIEISFIGIRPGEKMHEELFDESEVPEDTAHPHIVRINTLGPDFDADQFIRDFEALTDRWAAPEGRDCLYALARAESSAPVLQLTGD